MKWVKFIRKIISLIYDATSATFTNFVKNMFTHNATHPSTLREISFTQAFHKLYTNIWIEPITAIYSFYELKNIYAGLELRKCRKTKFVSWNLEVIWMKTCVKISFVSSYEFTKHIRDIRWVFSHRVYEMRTSVHH